MRLAIIDPGFSHSHAHHQTVNLLINSSLKNKGVEVTVLSAKNLDQNARRDCLAENMNVISFFDAPCYPPKADCLPKRQHEVLTELFSHELIALFNTGILQGNECLLLHTGFSFHIAGMARALWYLRDRIKGRLLVSMMFHPGARVFAEHDEADRLELFDSVEYLRYKLALRLLHATGASGGVEINIATPCRAYQRVYRDLWPGEVVQVHPAVGYQPLPTNEKNNFSRPRILLYLGGAKTDKGIEFALRLGISAAALLPQADFIFHFNNDFPGANSFAGLVENLRNAGLQHDNVQIIEGNIDVNQYNLVLQSCNIICLLYDPSYYSFKTSGVFWDALRRPNIGWLVSDKTWPSTELKELGIQFETVTYDNVQEAIEKLMVLLDQDTNAGNSQIVTKDIDFEYLELINSSFGEWLYKQFTSKYNTKVSGSVTKTNADYNLNRGRILVVRTAYGHFSPLSGPSGFIPHLRSLGYLIDEILVPLGDDKLKNITPELKEKFKVITQDHLLSYQANAVATETDIQRVTNAYDIVHFLDAEHCGLLTALYNLSSGLNGSTKYIATYHQPKSIMQQIVVNPVYMDGFDCIHLMSPCQIQFFEPLVGSAKLSVVPHGLAPELLAETLPLHIVGLNSSYEIPNLNNYIQGRKILLTVGNWLRDFEGLLETSKLLAKRDDIVFVVVSKNLELDIANLPNVLLLNQGINDAQLHSLYHKAELLFLPLLDGAANNAILEAMAHSLPIVTTDLPSTRYYTQGLAILTSPQPKAYATTLEATLSKLEQPDYRNKIRYDLCNRAKELAWRSVAYQMHENLYAPLINHL